MQAEKQLHSGELSHDQHQQLLKQLSELYEFQKLRVQEAFKQEFGPSGKPLSGKDPPAAQDRPADPRLMAMVKELEGGRRKSDSDERSALFPARDVDMRLMDPSRIAGPSDSSLPPTQLPPVDQDERQRPKGDIDLRLPPKKMIGRDGDGRRHSDTDMRQSGSDKDERKLPLSGDKDERLLKGRDMDERMKLADRDDRPPLVVGRDKDDRPPLDMMNRDRDERLHGPMRGPRRGLLPNPDEPPHRGAILLEGPLRRPPPEGPARMHPDGPPPLSRPGFHSDDSNRRPPSLREQEERSRGKPDTRRRGRGKDDKPPALQREDPLEMRHRPPRHEFDSRRNMDRPPTLNKEFEPRGRGPPDDYPPPLFQRHDDRKGKWRNRRGPPGPEPLDRDDRHHPGHDPRDFPHHFMDTEPDHPDDFDDRRFGRFDREREERGGRGGRGGRRREDDRRHPRDRRRDDRGPTPPDFDDGRGPHPDERGPHPRDSRYVWNVTDTFKQSK